MDKSAARDDLAVVDRILHAADRTFHVPPLIFITWGLYGTIVNGAQQAAVSGLSVPSGQSFHLPMMLLAIGITVWAAGRGDAERETLVDSHAGTTFCVAFGVILLLNLTSQHTVIPGRAMSLFWSGGMSIALLTVGFQSSRLLLGGGVALLAASALAGLAPAWFHGTLAMGWFAGMVVPGIVSWSRRAHG